MTFYGGVSSEDLKQFVERIERLEEEKVSIADDIKSVYHESKSKGFDPKIIREVIRMRKLGKEERDEQELLLETYKRALGMLPELDRSEAA